MFNELINKGSEPVGVVLMGVKEGFAKCNSEEEVILLKKTFQDILDDEADLRKDQV